MTKSPLEIAVEALRFYADKNHVKRDPPILTKEDGWPSVKESNTYSVEMGDKAREAIKSIDDAGMTEGLERAIRHAELCLRVNAGDTVVLVPKYLRVLLDALSKAWVLNVKTNAKERA